MKAILNYPGGKWSLADWIISFFPEKHHSYLEPYFGSGAVFFNKQRSDIETINDLDGDVVNFFECVKEDPEKLAYHVYFTPYSREIYEKSCQKGQEEIKDRFEKALNFFVRINMGYGFRTSAGKVGWRNDIQGREKAYAARKWCLYPDEILKVAERLRCVQIENRPALELIKRFNFKGVLIYIDPPYLLGLRRGKQYAYEMDNNSHEELLDTVLKHKGYVAISGYDSDLYNSMLSGWNKEETISRTQSGTKKKEILWMNYEPPMKQLSLEDIDLQTGII